MCNGVNRVVLVGLVDDIKESRPMATGGTVLTVVVKTSDRWKDKVTGDLRERIERHRVKAFGGRAADGLADVAVEDVLFIEGSLRTESYIDAKGQRRFVTVVVADRVDRVVSGTGERGEGGVVNRDRVGGESQAFVGYESRSEQSIRPGARRGIPVIRSQTAHLHQPSRMDAGDTVSPRESSHRQYPRSFGRSERV